MIKYKSGLKQPEDKNIFLKDILTGQVKESYFNFWKAEKKTIFLFENLYRIRFQQKFNESTSSLKRMISALKAFDEKANCLTATMYKGMASNGVTNIIQDLFCRMITPLECERLQTLPDGYTEGISNTRRYHALGNAWNVDTIVCVLMGLYNDKI